MKPWQSRKVVDPSGDRIGTVQQIFVSADDEEPCWALVGGILGHSAFVPLIDVDSDQDPITVPYYKDRVRRAPDVGSSDGLSADDEAAL